MTCEAQVRNIISDNDNIINEIKQSPHTYNTILQDCKDNGTLRQILIRRLKSIVNEGIVWKLRVPGTRFGLALFCNPDFPYKIIISQELRSVKVYYTFEYSEDDLHIILHKYWELLGPNWSKWSYIEEEKKIKKYSIRKTDVRIWE